MIIAVDNCSTFTQTSFNIIDIDGERIKEVPPCTRSLYNGERNYISHNS